MPSFREIEEGLVETLGLARRPVAVAYLDAAPAGVSRLDGVQPSGCSFWQLAAGGRTFYTAPEDHYNCPIGSYTHNVSLPPGREPELMQTLGFMGEHGYLRMEEIPSVFRLPSTPAAVIYSPLADAPASPDVVVVAGVPGRLMLLVEAAVRAGVYAQLPLLARPTCMALPAALQNGVVASAGCIGNRVYTAIGDEDLYVVLPGATLEKVYAELATIRSANQTLAAYHQGRLGLRA
jgi:uncharacterized protein (DUF169 family)